MKRKASCSCGTLSIVTRGPPLKVSVCHCLECQRRTGSAFGVAVFFASTSTEEYGPSGTFVRVGDSGKPVTFHFCLTCGSTVFWKPDFKPGSTAVALGCFDEKEGLAPTQSVYEEQRHRWVSIHVR